MRDRPLQASHSALAASNRQPPPPPILPVPRCYSRRTSAGRLAEIPRSRRTRSRHGDRHLIASLIIAACYRLGRVVGFSLLLSRAVYSDAAP